jgi:hypothetical protein
MNLKKSMLAAAVAGVFAMGVAGQANAYVYAGSVTEISNLVITINPFAQATIKDFNFTTTNTAVLNGVAAPTGTATCFGLPGLGGVANNCGAFPAPVLDGPTVSMGTPRPTNNFTLLGPNGLSSWSNSDSLVPTAQLVDFVPSQTQTIAEAELNGSGTSASANSEIQSTTNFLFSFTTQNPGTLSVNFNADTRLRAAIFGEIASPKSALASNKLSFTLTKSDGTRTITWAPNGSNFCDDTLGALSCVASDGGLGNLLNTNRSTGTNGSDINFDPVLASLSLGISNLDAGEWSLGLNVTNSVVLTRTPVPEPGVLALMGIGLLGVGMSARRKKLAS